MHLLLDLDLNENTPGVTDDISSRSETQKQLRTRNGTQPSFMWLFTCVCISIHDLDNDTT